MQNQKFPGFFQADSGIFYPDDSSMQIVDILEKYYRQDIRLVFDWGNAETGESWGEHYDISGYVGATTGLKKSPLLVHNRRSMGGYIISINRIVKISLSQGKRILYQHPTYREAAK